LRSCLFSVFTLSSTSLLPGLSSSACWYAANACRAAKAV
jgi:hypothetical protein